MRDMVEFLVYTRQKDMLYIWLSTTGPPTRLAGLNDPLVQTREQLSFDTGDPGDAFTSGIHRLSHLGSLDTLVSLS
jgi:hypothetical protein